MVAPSPGRSLGRSLPVLAAAPPAGQPIRPCPDIAPRRAPQPLAAHRALHRTGGGGIVAETATCPEPIMADQYLPATPTVQVDDERVRVRSEQHTSELQSLMRISYAVFCLKKTTQKTNK